MDGFFPQLSSVTNYIEELNYFKLISKILKLTLTFAQQYLKSGVSRAVSAWKIQCPAWQSYHGQRLLFRNESLAFWLSSARKNSNVMGPRSWVARRGQRDCFWNRSINKCRNYRFHINNQKKCGCRHGTDSDTNWDRDETFWEEIIGDIMDINTAIEKQWNHQLQVSYCRF